MKTILVVVPDLMFETRIVDTVRKMGYDVVSAGEMPYASLAIVGLENNRDWQSVVESARANNVPLLAFGRHTSAGLLRQARDEGCTRVVVNSDIAESLPKLLREMLNAPTNL